jgi:hypothetical protein
MAVNSITMAGIHDHLAPHIGWHRTSGPPRTYPT